MSPPWSGLVVLRKPHSHNAVSRFNPATVLINDNIFTITDRDLYHKLWACRDDHQRVATITAWRLTHGTT